MPLTIYRRHTGDCKLTTRDERSCRCPIWTQGTLDGRALRESLKTSNWQFAQSKVREWEAAGTQVTKSTMTIEDAWTRYIADMRARNLGDAMLRPAVLLSKRMLKFSTDRHIKLLSDYNRDLTAAFRETWGSAWDSDGNGVWASTMQRKMLTLLRSFFEYAVNNEWISKNPATTLKPPKREDQEKQPFTAAEVAAIVHAATNQRFDEKPTDDQRRALALVLLLRYSGLRCGDAVGLEVSRVNFTTGRLTVKTQKTKTMVTLLLPPMVLNELKAIPHASTTRFFWEGSEKLESATRTWRSRLAVIFEQAGVDGGHAHRFRHTFITDHLGKGTPVEQIATMVGHSDGGRIVYKHYAAWIPERQARLDQHARAAWADDPILEGTTTPKVVTMRGGE